MVNGTASPLETVARRPLGKWSRAMLDFADDDAPSLPGTYRFACVVRARCFFVACARTFVHRALCFPIAVALELTLAPRLSLSRLPLSAT